MSTSLTTARRAIAQRVDRYFRVGVATSGSTTSILENTAYPVKNTVRGQWWLNGWALRPAAGVGTIQISDTFTRTSATTLGTTDSGTAWSAAQAGTWGTSGSAAYSVSNANADANTIPCAKNGTLQVSVYGTFQIAPPSSRAGVIFRQDSTSLGKFLTLELTHSQAVLSKVSAGVQTTLQTVGGLSIADGTWHTWLIVLNGDSLTFTLDGVLLGTYTFAAGADATQYGTANANATGCGLYLAKSGSPTYVAAWDNFSFDNGTLGDRIRWIAADGTAGSGNSTGQLTVTPAWAVAPYVGVQGETYELYKVYGPDEIEAAINRALGRMMAIEETSITGVDAQLQYDLSNYTWITQKSQVVGLKLRSGTTAAQYTYRNIRGWAVTQDEGVLTLNLRSPYATTETLILSSLRDYASIGTLTAESDATQAPLEWLTWETIYELYQTPTALRSGALAQDEQNREEARVRTKLQAMRIKYRPQIERSMVRPGTRIFGPSVGGGVRG